MPRAYTPVANPAIACTYCGTTFTPKNKRRTYCYSDTCAKRGKRAANTNDTATCTDCGRPGVIARGLCSTHYSYLHRAGHGRSDRQHSKECQFCGGRFNTTTRATAYCSLVCAQRHRAGWSTSKEVAKRPKVRTWNGNPLPTRTGSALVAGQCAYCPNYFVGVAGTRYCSDRCKSNAVWKRRYDRRGEFKVTDKLRLAIYERDQYTCQLCNEPVDVTLHYQDMMAATLDHIIPQSHMLIPDHSMTNLRLAHRLCNSRRGDRTEG